MASWSAFLCEFMFGHTPKRMKIIIFTLYCVALFYIITWFTGLTASTDFIKMKYGWLDVPNKSIFYYIYILYTLVCYLLIFYLFFKARIVYRKQVYRNGFSEKLQQINILITGALLSASFGLFFNIIAPNLKNPLPSIGFLFLEFYIGSAFYCIFRYKSFILEDKIAPYVMEFLGETIVVIDENIRTVYVNDSFFNILNIDKCSHELIYLPDFIKSDTQEIIDFIKTESFVNKRTFSREVKLSGKEKFKSSIQTKMTCIPVQISRKQTLLIMSFSDINYRVERLLVNQNHLLEILAQAAEGRSDDYEKHVERMSEISLYIAEQYKRMCSYKELPEENSEIKKASKLHDIGKFAVSDSILNKPGKLTDSEFEEIKKHTTIGYNILQSMEGDTNHLASQVVLNHHENWDGTGYPKGLKKEEIPIIARIVSIADVVDALLTKRVYKEAMTKNQVAEFLNSNNGKKFDPKLIELLFTHTENNSEKTHFDVIVDIYEKF